MNPKILNYNVMRMIWLLASLLFVFPFINASAQKPQIPDLLLLKGYSYLTDEARLDSVIFEDYNYSTSEWIMETIYRYDYDHEGLIRITALRRNSVITPWINFWKEDYSNDELGNRIQNTNYMWDDDAGQWVPNRKSVYVFEGENMISDTAFHWNSDQNNWIKAWQGNYTVNANGQTTSDILYAWNTAEGIWINDYKDVYNFDAQGHLIESIGYSWIRESSTWNPETRNVIEWDESGNIPLMIGYDWNEVQQEWLVDNQREHEYDQNGNQTMRIYYVWDHAGQAWEPYDKLESIYNDQGLKYQDFRYVWDEEVSQWIYDYRQTYYSHIFTVGFPDVPKNQSPVLYPNPSQDFIYINEPDLYSLVIIYDMQGNPVLTQKLSGSDQIGIAHIPAGIYIYKILSRNKTVTNKIVIKTSYP